MTSSRREAARFLDEYLAPDGYPARISPRSSSSSQRSLELPSEINVFPDRVGQPARAISIAREMTLGLAARARNVIPTEWRGTIRNGMERERWDGIR